MSLMEWAKREVEIAQKRERGDAPENEFDYGCACYDSAFKAFQSLCEDRHSGMSIGFTKNILNRLIDGKPLTPIEDTEDIWNLCDYGENNGYTRYQCKRMSVLFKKVYPDGRIEYSSVDQCYCEDVNTGSTYTSGLESNIIRELYPITMPYMPGDIIKVVTEECLAYKKNGDYDTKGILYCVKDGEKVEINRFFAEAQDYPDRKEASVGYGWVEITYEEYVGRTVIAEAALRKEIRLKQCEMNCAAFENCSYKEEHSENYDWECEKFVSKETN